MFSSVCQFAGSVVSAHPSSPAGVRPVNRHLHPHSGTYGVSVGGRLSPVVGMSSSSSTTPCTTAAAMLHHHNHHQHSSCASSTSSTLLEHQKECSLCWPSHTYAKSRTIRLRRKDNNTSLGFSIRGGWEHGIGFYVSEVQQSSLAAKKGLCPGDQILQINGFPLERVVHEEVVALIRMSSNDLILRVRSAGIVPHKDHPGEVLTWKRLMHQHQTARLGSGGPAGGGTTNGGIGGGGGGSGHCTASASSEVSSFVFTRPRSAASDSFTPSSASSSSEEGHSPHHLCDHHLHLHPSSSEESSTSELTSTSPILGQYGSSATVSSYNEKQLYIRCHQPGSSLGCSVVNGPLTCPGIFVQNVKEGKLAAKCGLEIGDQIVKVNNVDVSAIGFDGAITLLKSLTELSLLVRKGVGRHIFECRDQYHIFDARKECHFSSEQSHAFSTSSKASLIKSPSESTLYYPASSSSSTLNPARSYAAYYHHHQYKTIQTAPLMKPCNVATASTNVSLDGTGAHFCASAAYSTVQISSNGSTIANGASTCDKSRCCCKRQRTVTTTAAPEASVPGQLLYETCGAPVGNPLIASTCSSCTLVMQSNAGLHPDTHHHHHPHHGGGSHHASGLSVGPPPPPPSSLFTADSARLDQVTSAMANSIRILREVREKEEKLVEASRMLNEEHQKLCREKEKLKLFEMDKSPSEHRKESNASTLSTIPTPPALMDGWSAVNSPYSTLSTAPIRGSSLASSSVAGPNSSKLRANSHSTVGPTFSFLEEVKALGESGIKRHLKPVNSNGDTLGSRGGGGGGGGGSASQSNGSPDTMNSDAKNKLLRRLPFANAGGSSKEAETKQRQHELLMEEFRIAHQRMFGGKENNGTLLGKIRARAAALEEEAEQPQPQQLSPKLEASKAMSCIPEPPPMREAPMQMTKVVSSGTNRSHTKEHYHHHPPAPPATASRMREKAVLPQHKEIYESTSNLNATAIDRTTMSNLANAANRITIKVLSPKIGS